MAGNPTVRFLPCLGGFVGSDILAGILATKLHESEVPLALIDLGTNGKSWWAIARLPLRFHRCRTGFEGARISMGMRAVTGAIRK